MLPGVEGKVPPGRPGKEGMISPMLGSPTSMFKPPLPLIALGMLLSKGFASENGCVEAIAPDVAANPAMATATAMRRLLRLDLRLNLDFDLRLGMGKYGLLKFFTIAIEIINPPRSERFNVDIGKRAVGLILVLKASGNDIAQPDFRLVICQRR